MASNPSETYTYDKVGRLATATDKRSKVMRAAYDVIKRSTIVSNDIGGGYKLEFNAEGLVIARIDADSKRTEMEYDNFLDMVKLVDPARNVIEYGYTIADGSVNGQAGSFHLPMRTQFPTFSAESRFDPRNRLTSNVTTHTNQQGQQVISDAVVYDKRGQITNATDAAGNARRFHYNSMAAGPVLGQATKTTKFSYEARGNLIEVIDANNHPRPFEYDRNNKLVKEQFALAQSIVRAYVRVGNLAFTIGRKKTKLRIAMTRLIGLVA